MCDFSEKLIAWIDGELPDDQAAAVDRHLGGCSECVERVAIYRGVSRAFSVYCATAAERATRRRSPRWVPVLTGAAAAVVLAVVLQMTVFRPVTASLTAVQRPVADTSPVILHEAAQKPIRRIHRPYSVTRRKTPRANWVSAEPTIQIALPAEAMFPPGAVPEGTTFIANLRMTPDGALQGLSLQE
jgi:negative regulator of sigma E activity